MDYNFVKPSHYAQITKDEAKFIFEQSEKHLKDQIDTSQQISAKTTTLLTVTCGILVGLIGFGINRWISADFDNLIGATFCCSVYLYIVIAVLFKNVRPSPYQSVGLHPRDIFDDKLFNNANKEYRMEALYINEIIECQKRIDFNKQTNDIRWRRFNRALRLIAFSPLVFLLLYGLIYLTSFLKMANPGCGL